MTARSMTDPMPQAMGVVVAPVAAMSSARPSTEAAVAARATAAVRAVVDDDIDATLAVP